MKKYDSILESIEQIPRPTFADGCYNLTPNLQKLNKIKNTIKNANLPKGESLRLFQKVNAKLTHYKDAISHFRNNFVRKDNNIRSAWRLIQNAFGGDRQSAEKQFAEYVDKHYLSGFDRGMINSYTHITTPRTRPERLKELIKADPVLQKVFLKNPSRVLLAIRRKERGALPKPAPKVSSPKPKKESVMPKKANKPKTKKKPKPLKYKGRIAKNRYEYGR